MLIDAYGDADTVYLTYIGKNALNNVRQLRGYKQGTYVKMWQGDEDNEVMIRLLAAHKEQIIAHAEPLQRAQSLLLARLRSVRERLAHVLTIIVGIVNHRDHHQGEQG